MRFVTRQVILLSLAILSASPIQTSAQPQKKSIISGYVFDVKTNQPLHAANVFIANSSLGDTTDSRGQFIIRELENGTFDLVVSMIGYQVIKYKLTISGPRHQPIIFKLVPEPPALSKESYVDETSLLTSRNGNCFDLIDGIDGDKTLRSWLKSNEELRKTGKSDPRIGFSFIELATSISAEEHYEKASEMYFCSLTEAAWDLHPKSILQEAKRTFPLLTDQQAKEWRGLIKKKDKSLITEIAQFWLEKDPTPSTLLNERLIQHWQRIAYARKNFVKSKKPPYRTDDRGVIYVKYGPPDRQRALALGSDTMELMRWAELSANINSPFALGTDNQLATLVSAMEMYMLRPECEIWAYTSLEKQIEGKRELGEVLFIFGEEGGSGSFRLVDGIEDLIPKSSFSRTATQTVGLPAGNLLQTMYYGQLIAFASHFQDRYDELESAWAEAERNSARAGSNKHMLKSFHNRTRSSRAKYVIENKYHTMRRYAPPDQSVFNDLANAIQFNTSKFRILDDRNSPGLVFTVAAIPTDLTINTGGQRGLPPYDINYTLILRDSTMREFKRFTTGNAPGLENMTFFRFADKGQAPWFTIAAEAMTRDTVSIIGSGKDLYAADPPLNPAKEKLEVSDLVIGVLPSAAVDLSGFPVPVLPTSRIWRGDALQVYFEAYHLEPDNEKGRHFRAEIRVTRLEKKKKETRRKEMIATAFNYQSATGTAKEFFGLNLSELEKGSYELAVKIIDGNSSQQKRRTTNFEILEK